MEFKESESNPTLNKTKTKVFENHQKFGNFARNIIFYKIESVFGKREKDRN